MEQVANSKAWQRYIENDPLFYHGGYKFGAAQVFSCPGSSIPTPCKDNLQEPTDNLQEPTDNLQEPTDNLQEPLPL